MSAPTSFWNIPSVIRLCFSSSPKVALSAKIQSFFGALRTTCTNCKKATRLCPCGYLGSPQHSCRCTSEQVRRYQSKISGPLWDRIDLHVEVLPISAEVLQAPMDTDNSSDTVRKRVSLAWDIQSKRQNKPNSWLTPKELDDFAPLEENAAKLLAQAMERLKLSARVYHRIIKIARTLADLANESTIHSAHIAEALQYRKFDRAGK